MADQRAGQAQQPEMKVGSASEPGAQSQPPGAPEPISEFYGPIPPAAPKCGVRTECPTVPHGHRPEVARPALEAPVVGAGSVGPSLPTGGHRPPKAALSSSCRQCGPRLTRRSVGCARKDRSGLRMRALANHRRSHRWHFFSPPLPCSAPKSVELVPVCHRPVMASKRYQ